MAGVIGRHKFIYDLWGDAVNTASRPQNKPGFYRLPALYYAHAPALPPDSIISTSKLMEYLLTFRARNDKSLWLAKAGYTFSNWEQLARDLRQQVLTQNAELDETNQYGMVYRITAQLVGPNGQYLQVVTIWMTEHETGQTKFITLYPHNRG